MCLRPNFSSFHTLNPAVVRTVKADIHSCSLLAQSARLA